MSSKEILLRDFPAAEFYHEYISGHYDVSRSMWEGAYAAVIGRPFSHRAYNDITGEKLSAYSDLPTPHGMQGYILRMRPYVTMAEIINLLQNVPFMPAWIISRINSECARIRRHREAPTPPEPVVAGAGEAVEAPSAPETSNEGPSEPPTSSESFTEPSEPSTECCICLDAPPNLNLAFYPCGHRVCCSTCVRSIQKCPLCRKQIREFLKLF